MKRKCTQMASLVLVLVMLASMLAPVYAETSDAQTDGEQSSVSGAEEVGEAGSFGNREQRGSRRRFGNRKQRPSFRRGVFRE